MAYQTDGAPIDARRSTTHRADASGSSRRHLYDLTSPLGLLLSVAAIFAFAQLVLFDEQRFLEWDEADYVDKASDRFGGTAWSVHRALGISWLLVPLFKLTTSFPAMRIYLILASSIAVTIAYASWLRPAGRVAALGMLLFCANWLTLFYGSEASPNLYVAAACVGVVGQLVQTSAESGRRPLVLLALGVALATLFRPTDGIVLAAGVSAAGFFVSGWLSAWKVSVAAALGLVAGFVPWTVDSVVNFGGPIDRWKQASDLVESSLRSQLSNHAKLLDGPLMGPDNGSGYPIAQLLIVLVLVVLSIHGVLMSNARRPAAVALALAGLVAAPYLFYVGASAPRFLLPAFGLLSMAAAIGAGALCERSRRGALVIVVSVVALGATSIAQANHVEESQVSAREDLKLVGGVVRSLAAGRDCRVLSQYGAPQIALVSGCTGERLVVASAGCQVQRLDSAPEVVIVTFIGAAPSGLEQAITDDEVLGPRGWRTAVVVPELAVCE